MSLFLFWLTFISISFINGLHDYDLPIMPDFISVQGLTFAVTQNISTNYKYIPRNIWIAVKDEKDELPVTFVNINYEYVPPLVI